MRPLVALGTSRSNHTSGDNVRFMSLTPITFTVRDAQRQPIALALLQAVSPNGNWQALTDDHGQFIANLAPGHYDVTATKDGYQALTVSTDIGAVAITLQSS